MATVRKIGVIAAKSLVVLIIILVTVLFVFDAFVQFRDSDKDLKAFFAAKKVPCRIGYYNSSGRSIRYLMAGNGHAPATILFIHGAPSSMSYFKSYLTDDTLLQHAGMLAVDRPGYGYSGLGKPETSMQVQARAIRPLLDSIRKASHPLVVVGVSYGTSIACRLAIGYPELVDGLVLVAPSLAPGEERIYPITYPIEYPVLKWTVPRMLITANAEKLSHRGELEKMLPYWKNVRMPVTYLQGKDDGLIYPANAVFARSHLVNAASLHIEMIPHRGHLIAFSEMKKIKAAILEMLEAAAAYRHPGKPAA